MKALNFYNYKLMAAMFISALAGYFVYQKRGELRGATLPNKTKREKGENVGACPTMHPTVPPMLATVSTVPAM